MATSRTTRSSASSSSSIAATSSRGKRPSSSPRRKRNVKSGKHQAYSAAVAYARSVATVVRAIEGLKHNLLNEAPSDEALDDFFDEVCGEEAFTFDFCRGPRWLAEAIARACEEVVDSPPGHSTVYLTELAEYGLIHGSVVVGEYMGSAVYFDDIQLGAVSLYPEQCETGARFLRIVVVDEGMRSRAAPN